MIYNTQKAQDNFPPSYKMGDNIFIMKNIRIHLGGGAGHFIQHLFFFPSLINIYEYKDYISLKLTTLQSTFPVTLPKGLVKRVQLTIPDELSSSKTGIHKK